ncbi:MAG: hypothetical protein ACREF5_00045 [Candidatus Saccharimonadales bacterium]
MSNSISFTRNLVKGRIAETIFAQMFRDNEDYTVLDFGYEKVVPQLVGQNYNHSNPVIESLRVAPDFAVINKDTKEVRLIEVKYQYKIDKYRILDYARIMHASWNPSYLFIATLDGFYFDEINKIIQKDGAISELKEISSETQSNYLQILKDFENQQSSA